MFTKSMALHEGGHGHAGCCGEHEHEHAHEHVCGHHHEHGAEVPELSAEQTSALMSYMTEHNRSHAAELHGGSSLAGEAGQGRSCEAGSGGCALF